MNQKQVEDKLFQYLAKKYLKETPSPSTSGDEKKPEVSSGEDSRKPEGVLPVFKIPYQPLEIVYGQESAKGSGNKGQERTNHSEGEKQKHSERQELIRNLIFSLGLLAAFLVFFRVLLLGRGHGQEGKP